MKTTLLMTSFLVMAISQSSAACMSEAQVRQSYYYCMKFLKFSPAKQVQHAKNAGIPVDTVRWACNLQKRKGLRRMLANNRLMCGYGDSSDEDGSSSSEVICYAEERCSGMPQPARWGPRGCSVDYKSYKDSSGRCHAL